jgi:hypothetical protein
MPQEVGQALDRVTINIRCLSTFLMFIYSIGKTFICEQQDSKPLLDENAIKSPFVNAGSLDAHFHKLVGVIKMEDLESKNYYTLLQPRLLEELSQILAAGKEVLISKYGQEFADELVFETRNELKKLIPDIPFIGGDKNPFTRQLLFSVEFLAFYEVMRQKGIDKGEGGIVSLKMFRDRLDSLVHSENNATRSPDHDGVYLQQLKKWASVSQQRLYPGDWVYEFCEGDGTNFDVGQDIVECAILKLYREYGMADVVPYICAMDILLSEARQSGLRRTQTLAEGGNKCDFRFKIGRKTIVGSAVLVEALTD